MTVRSGHRKYAVVMVRDRRVTAKTIEARRGELMVCMKTDKPEANRYSEANRAYAVAEMARMADYLQRHNLTGQFMQEDEQGQR